MLVLAPLSILRGPHTVAEADSPSYLSMHVWMDGVMLWLHGGLGYDGWVTGVAQK